MKNFIGQCKAKDMPKGELVKIVSKNGIIGKKIYVITGYDKSLKKYELQDWNDINDFRYVNKNQILTNDFKY